MAKINVPSPFYFISYSHTDTEQVLPIINYLKRKGFNIWYDAGIAGGSEWQEELGNAIAKCKGVIAFLSPKFITSKHCKREVTLADGYGKSIAPIYLEAATLSYDLEYLLSGTQAVFRYNLSDKRFYANLLEVIGGAAKQTLPTKAIPLKSSNKEKFDKAMQFIYANKPLQAYPLLKELSASGYHDATAELAELHLSGNGAEKDLTKAISLHSIAADKKVVKSLSALGNIYLKGKGVKIDKAKALDYYDKAAVIGDIDTALMLGKWYGIGENATKDLKKSLKYYAIAASKGSSDGQYYLGKIYYNGMGTKKDYVKAFEYYCKSSKSQNVDAIYETAFCYHNGKGTAIDNDKAIELLTLLTNSKYDAADLLLGDIYEGLSKSKEALKCYTFAAAHGNFAAKLKCANCYYDGIGTKVNYEKAYEIYAELAETGNSEAMLKHAICLFYGYGVTPDIQRAVKIFNELEKDEPSADVLYYFGLIYTSNKSSKFNPIKAEKYFLSAMRLGDKRAEFELGKLYFYGLITRINYKKALELFTDSASIASPEAYYYVGLCNYHSLGINQDFPTAFANLARADELGVAKARNLLGLCYYYGNGAIPNAAKAYKYFSSAYKNGDKAGACNTGICALLGRGTVKNPLKAIAILDANQTSSVECIYALSECNAMGIGVGANSIRAEELCITAANYEYPPALEKLISLYRNGGVSIDKSKLKASKCSVQLKNSNYLTEAILLSKEEIKS